MATIRYLQFARAKKIRYELTWPPDSWVHRLMQLSAAHSLMGSQLEFDTLRLFSQPHFVLLILTSFLPITLPGDITQRSFAYVETKGQKSQIQALLNFLAEPLGFSGAKPSKTQKWLLLSSA
jgi:hypothetical protein